MHCLEFYKYESIECSVYCLASSLSILIWYLFIYSSIDGQLGCFHFYEHLWQTIVWPHASLSLRCRINFLRNFKLIQIDFQGGYPMWHYQQLRMRAPVSSHPCQHLVWSVFLILVILIGIYLIMVFSCISLMTSHFEYLFLCFFAIHTSSLVVFTKIFCSFTCGIVWFLFFSLSFGLISYY